MLRAIPVAKIPVSSKHFGRPKGYFATTHEYLHSGAGRQLRNRSHEVYPAETIRYKLPFTLDGDVHWKFRDHLNKEMPPSYVFELENARFWGSYGGTVITADDRLLSDLSPDVLGLERHRVFTKFKLPRCRHLKGTIAVLSTPEAATNYWHWTFDLLPRIHLLEKAGFTPDKVNHYLVNHRELSYQIETLKELGIPAQKILVTDGGTHFEAEKLIATSLKPTQMHVSKWVCDFLRTFAPEAADTRTRRLFVSREKASFRRLKNEDEVLEMLRRYGFEKVVCEDLSVREQRAVFASAQTIVAPHGSGLTNLAYCAPDTTVIEIFAPQYIDIAFWTHACQSQLNHGYLIGEGAQPGEGIDPYARTANITVNVERLESILKQTFNQLAEKP